GTLTESTMPPNVIAWTTMPLALRSVIRSIGRPSAVTPNGSVIGGERGCAMGFDDRFEQEAARPTALRAVTHVTTADRHSIVRMGTGYFTGSGNANTGSTSIGTSRALARAVLKSAGILS